jgi:hypothetical protein
MATNLALDTKSPASDEAVTLALSYAFPLLPEASRRSIKHELLLPAATQALFGADGLDSGIFLETMDRDVVRVGQALNWAESAPSFQSLRLFQQTRLVQSMGLVSKFVAYSIEHSRDSNVVLGVQDALVAFTQRLLQHWQANKLSEVESSKEVSSLIAETLQTTWPVLCQFLKRIMYATVAILHGVVARTLLDRRLSSAAASPSIAIKSLHVLRNLYFISSQQDNAPFQIYTFTYLASIDILAQNRDACASFLQEIKPPRPASIPAHPLHRTLDLFYLNVAEHLPLSLSSEACDSLIVQPATAYLIQSQDHSLRMVELFEAAHSAILSVMSCPHNAPLTVTLAPFYAETLFRSFPSHISSRQFRLAFKTMMQIMSPPFPLSATHPGLAETLLEMVRYRVSDANPAPLPQSIETRGQPPSPDLASEQSTLVITLIDSLPFLPLHIVEVWMNLTAEALNQIQNPAMRDMAKRRFWDILVSGEMDIERAAIGVAWWGTKGGRELVLSGRDQRFMMSGAISDEPTASKL